MMNQRKVRKFPEAIEFHGVPMEQPVFLVLRKERGLADEIPAHPAGDGGHGARVIRILATVYPFRRKEPGAKPLRIPERALGYPGFPFQRVG